MLVVAWHETWSAKMCCTTAMIYPVLQTLQLFIPILSAEQIHSGLVVN